MIKFGPDGWRAIIAKDFTVDNVAHVAEGSAQWLNLKPQTSNLKRSVVVGYDCRFGGELFAETVAKVLAGHGIQVLFAKGFVSTPMISLGAVKYKTDLGIIITASHNPPAYNGFKLKGPYGGPLIPSKVAEIEALIPAKAPTGFETNSISDFEKKGLIRFIKLEDDYIEHVEKNFDLDLIRNSNLHLAYDAMYGAGQNVMKRLFPNITLLHCDYNPGFHGVEAGTDSQKFNRVF